MKGQSLIVIEKGRNTEGRNSGIKKKKKSVTEKLVVMERRLLQRGVVSRGSTVLINHPIKQTSEIVVNVDKILF